MKTVVRRRLAVGALATSGALVAGLLISPFANAADGDLRITPAGVENIDESERLTFSSANRNGSGTDDANYAVGGTATFANAAVPSASFTVTISPTGVPTSEGQATVDFTDLGDGLFVDGPGDAGIYNASSTGRAPGSGTDTCSTCFEITAAGPVDLSSVAPSSTRPGVPIARATFSGNNFERGTRITFFRNGQLDTAIQANNEPESVQQNAAMPGTETDKDNITTRTQLLRRITVAAEAVAGARDVRVQNVDGTFDVCTACFFVAGRDLTGVSDPSEPNDPNQAAKILTFTGPEIANGVMRLEYLGTVNGTTREGLTLVASGSTLNAARTSITGSFDFSNAAPGTYQPVVRSADGIVNACTCRFTVQQPAARDLEVTGVDQEGTATGSSQPAGTTQTFDVTGTGFSKGLAVTVSGTGVTTTAVEFVSPSLVRATFASTASAPTGARNVTVTLADGTQMDTCTGCYTVTAASASPSPSPSATATATTGFSFDRLAGSDRYATAARIATASFSTAETVLLANGQSDDPSTSRNENHFPDALAGAYLAGNRTAPTLLATETSLPQPTADALETLGTRNIVIIGGTAAVSADVERDLRADGFTVSRIAGATRYDTAKAVATTPPDSYVGENPAGERTAIVANGQNFPDALVSGPLGYKSKFPVLITTPNTLSSQTRDALTELNIDRVIIVGGTAAVSANVESQIKALEIQTLRLSGSDKTATAVTIARYAYDVLGFDRAHVNLARGDAFPDALAGGPHGGRENAPIVLTVNSTTVGTPTLEFLEARGSALRTGHIFGGTAAVSQAAEDQAEAAARRGNRSASPSPSASATTSPSASPSPTSGGGLPGPL